MNKITNVLLTLALGGFLATSAFAQTSTSPSQPAPNQPAPNKPLAGPNGHDPGHPRVNQVDNRLENQQDRIKQGLKNGTLTNQEAHQLYRKDQRIATQERKDMAANGGHLTKQEQKQMNKELNHNSKKIYKEKHGQ